MNEEWGSKKVRRNLENSEIILTFAVEIIKGEDYVYVYSRNKG